MKYPIKVKGKTCKQVTKLNLSGCNLKEIPEDLFFAYTNLTKLILSNNRIKIIPKEILRLKKLKVLDLANNDITILQSAVFKLSRLRTLNVYGNKIKKFPKQFYDSNIQKVIVGMNPIDPEEMAKLENFCEVVHTSIKEIDGQTSGVTEESLHLETTNTKEETKMEKKHSIFISYSHKDAEWLERVTTHLKPLNRYYGIDEWDDRRLRTSDKWKEEISRALNNATIAILLFSPNFMASDFIINNELQPLLENADKKGVKIMPVMVRPCATLEESGLSDYQAPNDPKQTLIEMKEGEIDRTLSKLVEDIKFFVKSKHEDDSDSQSPGKVNAGITEASEEAVRDIVRNYGKRDSGEQGSENNLKAMFNYKSNVTQIYIQNKRNEKK